VNWTSSPQIPQETWDRIYLGDKEAIPFQSHAWMQSITSGGHIRDVARLYETPDGQAILPLAASRGPELFASAASMPHGLGAGGLISTTPITPQLVKAVFDDLSRSPFLRTAVRPNARQIELWDQLVPNGWRRLARRTHILDLTGGMDVVFNQRFDSTKRNRIRKALKAGVSVEKGNSVQLVERFYNLYLLWSENRALARGLPVTLIRRLARLREPLWKFTKTAQGMGSGLQIYIASYEGNAVAASVFLIGGSSAVYWRGASNANLLREFPANDLLQFEMIKEASIGGCQQYHMGESGGVASLERFKEHFGAKSYSYAEYVRERLPLTLAKDAIDRFRTRPH
jgi:hypothetical protein